MKIQSSYKIDKANISQAVEEIGHNNVKKDINNFLLTGTVKKIALEQKFDIRKREDPGAFTIEYISEVHVFSYEELKQIKEKMITLEKLIRKFMYPDESEKALEKTNEIMNLLLSD